MKWDTKACFHLLVFPTEMAKVQISPPQPNCNYRIIKEVFKSYAVLYFILFSQVYASINSFPYN